MCVFWCAEEKKAEDEEFESDLIAGRLREDVVRALLRAPLRVSVIISLFNPVLDLSNVFQQLEQKGRLQRLIASEVSRGPVPSLLY